MTLCHPSFIIYFFFQEVCGVYSRKTFSIIWYFHRAHLRISLVWNFIYLQKELFYILKHLTQIYVPENMFHTAVREKTVLFLLSLRLHCFSKHMHPKQGTQMWFNIFFYNLREHLLSLVIWNFYYRQLIMYIMSYFKTKKCTILECCIQYAYRTVHAGRNGSRYQKLPFVL